MKKLLIIILVLAMPVVSQAQAIDFTKPFELAANIGNVSGKPWANVDKVSGKAKANIKSIAGAGVAAAQSCQPFLAQTGETDPDYMYIAGNENSVYSGPSSYTPSQNITVCQVTLDVKALQGDLTGITYQVEIYTMAESPYSLITLNSGCTSNGKSITGAGTVTFDGLNCSLTTSGSYGVAFTVSDHAVHTDHYPILHCGTLTFGDVTRAWKADKTSGTVWTSSPKMTIYTLQ